MQMNWLAVLAAAVSALVLGGVWYGPLFGRARSRATPQASDPVRPRRRRVFATAFLASLAAAVAFATLLGPAPGLHRSVHHGLLTGLGVAATTLAIHHAFAGRSLRTWLIDGGYHALQFTLYGLIIGLWQ